MISWKKVKRNTRKNVSFTKKDLFDFSEDLGKKVDDIFLSFKIKRIKSFHDSKRIVLD
ncbi:hypothetical protein KKG48_00735 [Patescibacteria group bacterium]|nr:hypothetical protein [Patescibacteria group bacterium]MCG2694713.1 hypothetical protein [Candidatus Parcubacteria bacterium]